MSPYAERLRKPSTLVPVVLVTVFGLWLLWPLPFGRMPLSADHTVHLTRIWMWARELAGGSLRGWSAIWFFGTPTGELYPVLGDLLVVLVRAISFGLLSWSQAYAIGFSLVFVAQGWVMLRVGRAMGLGPLPGLVAAGLVMADAGAYREGGWTYTVSYGVWPQTLATSLSWLAFAQIALATQALEPAARHRRIAAAALSIGASLLAHPMSMVSIALGGPLLVAVLGMWSRERLRRAAAVGTIAAVLGVALCAWWLWPMLGHRGWMASYGWLWLPLDRMAHMAFEGQLTQNVPTAVTLAGVTGLGLMAVGGPPFARFAGAYALAAWMLASHDAVWTLRLDRLSEGFTHIQYQRFLTVAKPGLFAMAGATVGVAAGAASRAWRWPHRLARPIASACAATAIALFAWMAIDEARVMRKRHVGDVQLERMPGRPQLDADYAALLDWMEATWAQRKRFYRATVHDDRNLHWFMDAPVYTSMPVYKQGFTPGDNFVHKPETGAPALLDRLQVRYVISRRRSSWRGAEHVATFGSIKVFERHGWRNQQAAWLEGPGTIDVLEDATEQGRVRVRVDGSGGSTRLVFGIAGYPRWVLEGPDGPVEWFEVPVLGDGPPATIQERRSGALRGGKAHGNDGTEPTLVAAEVGDGEHTLRYRAWQAPDILGLLLSVAALGACALLLWRPRGLAASSRWLGMLERRLGVLAHPLVLLALAVSVAGFVGWRQQVGSATEATRAFGWLLEGRASAAAHTSPGFVKTDMLIRPAIVVDRRRDGPALLELPGVELGETLRGWVALDDDAAKVRSRGAHRVRIEARRSGTDAWSTLKELSVPHRPGRRPLEVGTRGLAGDRADLRVVVTSRGEAPPPIGFDLELGGEA